MHSLPREPKNQEGLLPEGYENYGSFSYGSPYGGELNVSLSFLGSWFLACQPKAVTVYSFKLSSSMDPKDKAWDSTAERVHSARQGIKKKK